MARRHAKLGPMNEEQRGAEIRRRMDALRIGLVELATEAGVARNSVFNATKGTASEKTMRRVEAALDALETGVPDVVAVAPEGTVEFTIVADDDIRVVVKGAVADVAELERQVVRLVQDLRDASRRNG